jgi:hypothetical protein
VAQKKFTMMFDVWSGCHWQYGGCNGQWKGVCHTWLALTFDVGFDVAAIIWHHHPSDIAIPMIAVSTYNRASFSDVAAKRGLVKEICPSLCIQHHRECQGLSLLRSFRGPGQVRGMRWHVQDQTPCMVGPSHGYSTRC